MPRTAAAYRAMKLPDMAAWYEHEYLDRVRVLLAQLRAAGGDAVRGSATNPAKGPLRYADNDAAPSEQVAAIVTALERVNRELLAFFQNMENYNKEVHNRCGAER